MRKLAAEMSAAREGADSDVSVCSGDSNHIVGRSGYIHQIDVSVRTRSELVLYECKYWGRNVEPDAVLAFAARGIDIAAQYPELQVQMNIVVNRRLSSGARVLANYFSIEEQVVISATEFSVGYKTDRQIGLHDTGSAQDSVELEVDSESDHQ